MRLDGSDEGAGVSEGREWEAGVVSCRTLSKAGCPFVSEVGLLLSSRSGSGGGFSPTTAP